MGFSKGPSNLKRHGVAFERAATIFLDRSALSEFDEPHSETEERWITLGLDQTGVLLSIRASVRVEVSTDTCIAFIRSSTQIGLSYRYNRSQSVSLVLMRKLPFH
jgi:uncharacterized protein